MTGDVTGIAVTCSPKLYSIGGSVQGLGAGKSLTLQDNGADSLTLTATGSYVFPTKLASGATYDVTVSAQPAGQACTVVGGAGTVTVTNVGNVIVNCH